ncbi:MAG: hypothetical protein K2P79_13580, partial [Sphingomonas sp.]|nr:hypothetical protein [Sphingomonas sp.]
MRGQAIAMAAMLAVVGPAVFSEPAAAQSPVEGRVDRLEREMRAVQRKVFPGGAQNLAPQIAAPDAATVAPGTPATNPVADLAGRVNALESQMTSLTGQIEQAEYKLRMLDEAFTAYRRSTDARLKAIEEPTAVGTTGAIGGPGAAPMPAAATTPVAKPKPPTTTTATATPIPADPARARLVAAVERPATDDAADDAYVYGYRLWQAKFYPEAQAQLKTVVTKWPKSSQASFAQ